MLVRRFLAALGVVATLGAVLAAPPLEAAPRALARTGVTPKDVIAGSTGAPFTFEVANIGEVPLTTVRVVRPSTSFRITGASAPAPWSATASSPDLATFRGGILLPGAKARFTVLADVSRIAGDQAGAWSVLTSTTGGDTYKESPGEGGSVVGLTTTIRVLRVGNVRITTPGADDGTVSTSQWVEAVLPVTNEGTAPILLTWGYADGPGNDDGAGGFQRDDVALAPGESALMPWWLNFGPATGDRWVRLWIHDREAAPVHQEAVARATVQPAAWVEAKPSTPLTSSLSCAPDPAVAGRPLACTLDVLKHGTPTIRLEHGTAIRFADDDGDEWQALLEHPTSFGPGEQEGTLTFFVVPVPAEVDDGSWLVSFAPTGNDGNGAHLFPEWAPTTDSVVVDTPPAIVEASTGRQADGTYVVNLRMSEPVSGTERVDDWVVRADDGTVHPLVTVDGSGTGWWTLVLASSPAFDADGTPLVSYAPGDLADAAGNPLEGTTVEAADRIS